MAAPCPYHTVNGYGAVSGGGVWDPSVEPTREGRGRGGSGPPNQLLRKPKSTPGFSSPPLPHRGDAAGVHAPVRSAGDGCQRQQQRSRGGAEAEGVPGSGPPGGGGRGR